MVHSFKAEKISCTFSDLSNTYQVQTQWFYANEIVWVCSIKLHTSMYNISGTHIWPICAFYALNHEVDAIRDKRLTLCQWGLFIGFLLELLAKRIIFFIPYYNAIHHNSFKEYFQNSYYVPGLTHHKWKVSLREKWDKNHRLMTLFEQ